MLRFYASENNKGLSDFIREYLDCGLEMCADAGDNEEEEYIKRLFPEFKWAEDRDKCVKMFCEFRARLADEFLHEPTELEWYVLMEFHDQWRDVFSDLEPVATSKEEKEQFEKDMAMLDKLEGYFDGDCQNVASLFNLYKANPLVLDWFGVDLDRFSDLMPRDFLEEYMRLRAIRGAASEIDPALFEQPLTDILAKGEGQQIEFKERFSDHASSLAKEMAGFATSNDGVILMGVDNFGKTVKLCKGDGPDRAAIRRRVLGISRQAQPRPSVQVEFDESTGELIAVIKVKRGDKPLYYYEGRPYLRDGEETRIASPEEVEEILLHWARPK